MKRLLCIISGGMNRGGAETFLMKVYRKIDKTQYQIDFAVGLQNESAYDKEIIALGGKVINITPKSKSFVKNFTEIKNLVRNEKYQYVLRVGSHSLSALDLLAARFGGAKVCAYRSSNSKNGSSKAPSITHTILSFMPKLFANVKIAPSTEAAEHVFGKSCMKNKRAFILHNGIDLDVYRFSQGGRDMIRDEFSLSDKLVIGNIARFYPQKNHSFLIDAFNEIQKNREDAVLLLVGKGELENEIRRKIDEYGISEKVIFAGERSDVPSLLSAMDAFVMTSFFEGMPNVVIEAQATGLPCVIADTITREADITGLVKYLPLGDVQIWSQEILSAVTDKRRDTSEEIRSRGYDINEVTEDFVRLIFK